jgi:hypothetical protein
MRLIPILLLVACGSSQDQDHDGFGILQGDCDDYDDSIHPAAPEVCNGVDDDCDGTVDDDAAGGPWWYVDADGDGYGLSAYSLQHCGDFPGWAQQRGDCDDGASTVFPGADESCNGVDDDCDGRVDENAVDVLTVYRDEDGDGYGDAGLVWQDCEPGSGWVQDDSDCDDSDPAVHPDAEEICWTAVDDDCDGDVNDPEAEDCSEFYEDADGDGYGGAGACLCELEEPYILGSSEDCDDSDASIYPGAEEPGGWVDHDCDGGTTLAVADGAIRLLGVDEADRAGRRVAGLGDVNGDGLMDLGVGAYGEDSGASAAGAIYVILGPVTADMSLDDADARLLGVFGNDWVGTGLAGAGDVDADGFADILVGASGQDTGGSGAGAAYLVLGPVTGDLSMTDADATFTGLAANDSVGCDVAGGQDVNGDGVSDILLGAYNNDTVGTNAGAAYLFHGPVTGDHSVDEADALMLPPSSKGNFGQWLALGSDQDGDGLAEVLVGCPLDDWDFSDQGALYLYQGPVAADDATYDAAIIGEYSGHNLGSDLAGDMDLDGDGLGDIAVSASGSDIFRDNAGAAYVVTGSISGELVMTEVLAARILGPAEESSLTELASAGDVDGDGRDDLLLGARYYDEPYEDGGRAWLLYGPVTGNIDLAQHPGVAFEPEGAGDQLGNALAGVGDTDGDGTVDFLMGARDASVTDGAGAAYLFLGAAR